MSGTVKNPIKFILDIVRGIVIGIANVIPGVSGGTMMVSMGIYDDIIGSINNIFKSKKSFVKSIITLLPYGIGMLVGIVGFAWIIEFLFEKFPIPTALLFIGLILGCLPMIYKNVKGHIDLPACVLFLFFFALVIVLQVLGEKAGLDRALTLSFGGIVLSFVLGIIGSATMIIPGVSGSMVMMILGYYHSIIGTIKEAAAALLAFDLGGLLKNIGILLPFLVGVVVGIFGVAKLIEFLLKKYKAKTYAGILGLIVASPYPVFAQSQPFEIGVFPVIFGVMTFALGIFAALKLGKEE